MATTVQFKQDDELTSLLSMLTLDDLIAGVVAKSGVEVFTSCTASLHGFFARLQGAGGMPEAVERVLGTAVFESGDWFPFSREVERALFRLSVGGLFSADNPEYSRLRMKAPARKKALKRIGAQDKDTQKFVAKAAKEFAKTLRLPPIEG